MSASAGDAAAAAAAAMLAPPAAVRGMTQLDRAAFQRAVRVPALRLPAGARTAALLRLLKPLLLHLPGVRPVQPDGDQRRLALLDPARVSAPADLPWSRLAELGVPETETLQQEQLTLTYENFAADTVLRAVLPEREQNVAGFSRIGHLIHLNLKPHAQPFGALIGAVLMDKQPGVRCVVNKLNTIDNTFRNFSMEVLAGEPDFVVDAKENGCSFRMDFSKVYWNPRLCTEHARVVDALGAGDTLADVFAGVGPFAVLAARRRHRVIANDLNPESVRWLRHNLAANKVKGAVDVYNMDGREFIRTEVRRELREMLRRAEPRGRRLHAVCNLPALAIEFVDAFVGLLSPEELPAAVAESPLRVHVHTFTKEPAETARAVLVHELGARLGYDVSEHVHEVLMVRNVAPNKLMYRISWDVPPQLLVGPEPPAKRSRRASANGDADLAASGGAGQATDGDAAQTRRSDSCTGDAAQPDWSASDSRAESGSESVQEAEPSEPNGWQDTAETGGAAADAEKTRECRDQANRDA